MLALLGKAVLISATFVKFSDGGTGALIQYRILGSTAELGLRFRPIVASVARATRRPRAEHRRNGAEGVNPCEICGQYIYRDGSLQNDNFLHLCNQYDRNVYEWMRSRSEHCRRDGCSCAYSHIKGLCRKCGHFTAQVMLPTGIEQAEAALPNQDGAT